MRAGGFGVLLAGLGLVASTAGCGPQAAGADGAGNALAAAVSRTTARTARVAITMSAGWQGMTTLSTIATGTFDFAHSRGTVTILNGTVNVKEIFLPPKIYLKPQNSAGMGLPNGTGLPKGKSWLAISDVRPGMGVAVHSSNSSDSSSYFVSARVSVGHSSPADLLASLTAISGGEKKMGTTTIRGVPVTEYQADVDPAKAAAGLPSAERASFRQFAKMLGSGTIPVHAWVDSENLLRRVQMTFSPLPAAAAAGMPGSPGTSGHLFRVSLSADYYDFGVPMYISPPPAAQVASLADLGKSGWTAYNPPSLTPPMATGTLTPGQKAAAGKAVGAFWTAVGTGHVATIARAVLPAQQACVRYNFVNGTKLTVSSFRVVSVEPAGTGKATVRYQVAALPLYPKNAVEWISATERVGHWYVNLNSGDFTCP